MNMTPGVLATEYYLLIGLTGCSVAMALSGHTEPNFDAFELGSTRKQVEIQLGSPVASQPLENGRREDTYRYEIGNSPNGHRTIMDIYINLVTFGLWELPGTIAEAMMGHEEESKIVSGPENRGLEIHGYRSLPPFSRVGESPGGPAAVRAASTGRDQDRRHNGL